MLELFDEYNTIVIINLFLCGIYKKKTLMFQMVQ